MEDGRRRRIRRRTEATSRMMMREYKIIANLPFQKEANKINDPFLVDIIVKGKIK